MTTLMQRCEQALRTRCCGFLHGDWCSLPEDLLLNHY